MTRDGSDCMSGSLTVFLFNFWCRPFCDMVYVHTDAWILLFISMKTCAVTNVAHQAGIIKKHCIFSKHYARGCEAFTCIYLTIRVHVDFLHL